eukprot:TRINITY_DN3815_c0_g1_i4.p1 TRINITY_DN3815_c0_g1~~TRINITY_DN3815_c0_g1_i4.p1  ORF type:complete len:630 (+),score=-29.94 TRINITY_DN3815_c0_g1_i4:351-2240(+)
MASSQLASSSNRASSHTNGRRGPSSTGRTDRGGAPCPNRPFPALLASVSYTSPPDLALPFGPSQAADGSAALIGAEPPSPGSHLARFLPDDAQRSLSDFLEESGAVARAAAARDDSHRRRHQGQLLEAARSAVARTGDRLRREAFASLPLLVDDARAHAARIGERAREVRRCAEQQALPVLRCADFWRRVAHIYGGYKLCQLRASLPRVSADRRAELWRQQHEAGGEQLLRLCTDLRGFFLKAGQFLAKPDVSPEPWVRRLASLHDAAPADAFPLVLRALEAEVLAAGRGNGRAEGEAWRDVFERVEERPVGSASIAQVHRAWLKGGREVAVKIQHPGCEPLMLMDLRNLKAFAAFLQRTELRHMDVLAAVNELESQVRVEFDFRQEAAAMERVRRAMAQAASPVVVPRTVPDLVTRRMLVMDFITGTPILRLPEELRRRGVSLDGALATRAKSRILGSLGRAYGHMLLRDGHFQADPHPGNILLLPNADVALLDYGQTKQLGEQTRLLLAEVIVAMGDDDVARIGRVYKKMGFQTALSAQEDPSSFRWMASQMFDTKRGDASTSVNPFSADFGLNNNKVQKFPEDLFFVVRTMQLLRGLAMGMGVNHSVVDQWRPLAKQVLKEAKRAR